MDPTHLGKILLVDDDPDTRSIYGEFLTQAGYDVFFAADGEEGLAKIIEGGYDLILLDIMMPKIDGIDILKKLQMRGPKSYNGPIVMLSALDQDRIVRKALQLGAKGFLSKPKLTPDMALDEIKKFILGDLGRPQIESLS